MRSVHAILLLAFMQMVTPCTMDKSIDKLGGKLGLRVLRTSFPHRIKLDDVTLAKVNGPRKWKEKTLVVVAVAALYARFWKPPPDKPQLAPVTPTELGGRPPLAETPVEGEKEEDLEGSGSTSNATNSKHQQIEQSDGERWQAAYKALVYSDVGQRLAGIAMQGFKDQHRGAILARFGVPTEQMQKPGTMSGEVQVNYVPVQHWENDVRMDPAALRNVINQIQTYDPTRSWVLVLESYGITGGSIVEMPMGEIAEAGHSAAEEPIS
eukprot:gnl/MRDRNA2_/MRDRNA2_81084_c0_seq1.p1 gnl/MRDRNA2_/MRDRNA2_81084_c0~~gnl/MRDRNA2_/MRDRNA2_81084_c0_seq1.p1  ORF type:complete len:266 (-),score=50.09 gnl/MRDRNA2_/MRDRNA2_81084_c0_seq1:201-998(-)